MRTAQVATSQLTPGRTTTISFDYTEEVLTEAFYLHRRRGDQMEPTLTENVIRLSSGAWVLQPVNDALTSELSANDTFAMRLTDFSAASIVKEITRSRKLTELTGIGAAGGVATTGDYWFIKRVAAGANWSTGVIVAGDPAPILPTANYPLDRIAFGTPLHLADTGYLVKLHLPGAAGVVPDWMFGFGFGGQLTDEGYGKFYLALAGDGRMKLFEHIEGAWSEVGDWRIAAPSQTVGQALVLRILPHAPRFLEISAIGAGVFPSVLNTQSADVLSAIRRAKSDPGARATYLHETGNRPNDLTSPDDGFLPIVGNGHVTIDVRRDQRLQWAISRLAYPDTGLIEDRPFNAPYGVTDAHVIRAISNTWDTFADDDPVTAVIAVVEEADGTALTPDTEIMTFNGGSETISGYNCPGGLNQLRVAFELANTEDSGEKWHTPVLLGYQVQRNGHTQTHAPGVVAGFGKTTQVSITGQGVTTDEESASVQIEDVSNNLAFLRTRGRIGIQVLVEYAPATTQVVAFEGYTGRATASLKGKFGKTFPSPLWHGFDIECMGKADRLAGLFFSHQLDFSDDLTSPEGREGNLQQTWKVTSALRYALMLCGFPDSQILIEDDPIRLFSAPPTAPLTNLAPNPDVNPSEWLHSLARDYTNSILYFDFNALATGAWRLKRAPTTSTTAVWNFVTTRPAAGRLAHLSASYGASTSPVLSRLDRYIIPPEFNVLVIRGGAKRGGNGTETVQATYVNKTSFNAPDHPATADENDPSYLGRLIAVEWDDPTLDDQDAVDFIGRRAFELRAKGRQMVSFVSDYVLLPAAALEPTVYTFRLKRPLLPLDVVNLDGVKYVIRSVNPHWSSDGHQQQYVEAEKFASGLTWG